MMYKNAETYINEEYIKPIKYMLEKNFSTMDIMAFVCSLGNKYLEMAHCASSYEKFIKEDTDVNMSDIAMGKRFMEYMNSYPYVIDFDCLPSPFSVEEDASRSYSLFTGAREDTDKYVVVMHGDIDHENYLSLGGCLRAMRIGAGKSQKDLASLCGITAVYYNMIERGRVCGAGFDIVYDIAKALGYEIVFKKKAVDK